MADIKIREIFLTHPVKFDDSERFLPRRKMSIFLFTIDCTLASRMKKNVQMVQIEKLTISEAINQSINQSINEFI